MLRTASFWRRASFTLGLFVATSGLIAACGGGSAEGSDEDYVRAICESSGPLEEALSDAIAAAFDGDEDEGTAAFASALSEWADALDDANPPADVAETHDALVDGLRDAIAAVESGDADLEAAFDSMDSLPEPSQAIQDRLAAVADELPECENTDFFD